MQKIILGILGLGVVAGLGFLVVKTPKVNINQPLVTNFDECAKAGYPVMESYPEQCKTPDGRNFVREVSGVVNPTPAEFGKAITLNANDKVTFSDGLNIELKQLEDSRCKPGLQCFWAGELGGIFALFGGKLTVSKEIHLGTSTSKSVSLEGYTFSLKDVTTTSITIVVVYKNPTISLGSCFIGGCSSQICSDQKDIVSTCEYREEDRKSTR